MKRKIIANTALTLILASSFMTGVKATETSNQVLKVETEYKELPSSIGENILTKILKQQECNRQPQLNIFCSLTMNTFYSLKIFC